MSGSTEKALESLECWLDWECPKVEEQCAVCCIDRWGLCLWMCVTLCHYLTVITPFHLTNALLSGFLNGSKTTFNSCVCVLIYWTLRIISLIMNLRHSFSCQEQRDAVSAPTKTPHWFPPGRFLPLEAKGETKHNLLWLPAESPTGALETKPGLRIVSRYESNWKRPCMWFSCLVKM